MGESARTSRCRQFIVDLSKKMIAEGGFSAVVEPSLETERSSGCSTLGNDGRILKRVSVMEVHQICDEKARKHSTTEVHWFELDLVGGAARLYIIGHSVVFNFGDSKCNRGLGTQNPQ
jgi:hypothetical protein